MSQLCHPPPPQQSQALDPGSGLARGATGPLVALLYQGIPFTSRETVIDIGPIHATADREKTLSLPPVLGIMAVAGGAAPAAAQRLYFDDEYRSAAALALAREEQLADAVAIARDLVRDFPGNRELVRFVEVNGEPRTASAGLRWRAQEPEPSTKSGRLPR